MLLRRAALLPFSFLSFCWNQFRRLRRRLRNLFSKGATSPGLGGRYDAASGDYRGLDSESVFLDG